MIHEKDENFNEEINSKIKTEKFTNSWKFKIYF